MFTALVSWSNAPLSSPFPPFLSQGFSQNLHAVFCLAENAVGPVATRPDDIHTLYSGKTVEINNTDAEGRLVLGDGVAFARKDLKADWVIDMATLTGAQVTPLILFVVPPSLVLVNSTPLSFLLSLSLSLHVSPSLLPHRASPLADIMVAYSPTGRRVREPSSPQDARQGTWSFLCHTLLSCTSRSSTRRWLT